MFTVVRLDLNSATGDQIFDEIFHLICDVSGWRLRQENLEEELYGNKKKQINRNLFEIQFATLYWCQLVRIESHSMPLYLVLC